MIADAVVGAVVSKPMPMKTTSLPVRLASATASSTPNTMWTSAPSALASFREPFSPGTFITSPKAAMVRPALASARTSSTSLGGVTHTGHPGPCRMSTPTRLNSESRPNLIRVS